jgi:hypothetical protein
MTINDDPPGGKAFRHKSRVVHELGKIPDAADAADGNSGSSFFRVLSEGIGPIPRRSLAEALLGSTPTGRSPQKCQRRTRPPPAYHPVSSRESRFDSTNSRGAPSQFARCLRASVAGRMSHETRVPG